MKISLNNTIHKKEVDLVIVNQVENSKKITAKFENSKGEKLILEFELIEEDISDINDFNFFISQNKKIIFYRFIYQWGVINFNKRKLIRKVLDYSIDFPIFSEYPDCFLIEDNSFVETLNNEGKKIDRIPNEEPYNLQEYEDFFELELIGLEKRKIRRKLDS
ncbi:hypothetical protein [Aureivirga sp. CE67]|uniref:hypothetical protein n=1 Tax=Aureivirga sp. CE67 TaxID=1788983 RepID=UPI0018C93221|nr:hypothetical protein [Aureivirga sp. CE67]